MQKTNGIYNGKKLLLLWITRLFIRNTFKLHAICSIFNLLFKSKVTSGWKMIKALLVYAVMHASHWFSCNYLWPNTNKQTIKRNYHSPNSHAHCYIHICKRGNKYFLGIFTYNVFKILCKEFSKKKIAARHLTDWQFNRKNNSEIQLNTQNKKNEYIV